MGLLMGQLETLSSSSLCVCECVHAHTGTYARRCTVCVGRCAYVHMHVWTCLCVQIHVQTRSYPSGFEWMKKLGKLINFVCIYTMVRMWRLASGVIFSFFSSSHHIGPEVIRLGSKNL